MVPGHRFAEHPLPYIISLTIWYALLEQQNIAHELQFGFLVFRSRDGIFQVLQVAGGVSDLAVFTQPRSKLDWLVVSLKPLVKLLLVADARSGTKEKKFHFFQTFSKQTKKVTSLQNGWINFFYAKAIFQ